MTRRKISTIPHHRTTGSRNPFPLRQASSPPMHWDEIKPMPPQSRPLLRDQDDELIPLGDVQVEGLQAEGRVESRHVLYENLY